MVVVEAVLVGASCVVLSKRGKATLIMTYWRCFLSLRIPKLKFTNYGQTNRVFYSLYSMDEFAVSLDTVSFMQCDCSILATIANCAVKFGAVKFGS